MMDVTTFPKLGRMEVHRNDPPTYYWYTDHGVLRFYGAKELEDPKVFAFKCLDQLNIVVEAGNRQEWYEFVKGVIPNAVIVQTCDSLTPRGVVWDAIGRWAFDPGRVAELREGLLRNRPWIDSKDISWFQLMSLREHLHLKRVPVKELPILLQERCKHHREMRVDGKRIWVWGVERTQFPYDLTEEEKAEFILQIEAYKATMKS